MAINWRVTMRKAHRWGAILIALPFLVIIGTGILLQLKKDWSWVQPPTAKGSGKTLDVSFDQILDAARSVPQAGVQNWNDVDRLDVRPDRGLVKVQAKNGWEIQVDTTTGAVLQVEYRRSDVIEQIHDGSWFHDKVKLFVFLPVAIILLGLWITGVYLFVLPYGVRLRRQRERAARKARASGAG